MLHSLDRVVLAVSDLDAGVRQYARLLGRTPSWRGEQPVAGTQNSLFRLGNSCLELVAPMPQPIDRVAGDGARGSGTPFELAEETLRGWLDAHGEGLLGLVFATTDVSAFHEALVARGQQLPPVVKEIDRDVESGAFREWRRASLSLAATRGIGLSAVESLSDAEGLAISAALGDERACVAGLDHTVVQTRDADAARKLYGDDLGLRLALEREFPKWGSRLQFFRVGGVTIEVASSLPGAESNGDRGENIAAGVPALHDRLWGLCWRVPDAARARERLQAVGFEVSGLRDGRKPGTRVFSVREGTCGVPTLVLEPPGTAD